MSINPGTELELFQQFIIEQLQQGRPLSPEEALDLWRIENPKDHEFSDTVTALREAISEMDSGDLGMPLDEFDRAFRRNHGLPSST